jgi:hypothetical protein
MIFEKNKRFIEIMFSKNEKFGGEGAHYFTMPIRRFFIFVQRNVSWQYEFYQCEHSLIAWKTLLRWRRVQAVHELRDSTKVRK